MDLNDLTPELFEKAEFAERRRGYDIDQVETFLEETGTAVAQLLVRHRQLEERANAAEARLAEVDSRLADAESRLAEEQSRADSERSFSEKEDIERATSTLVMAKRTADATISEAEGEAERIRREASARADSILHEARRTAEEELYNARKRTTEVVTSLEARRDAVASLVEGLEQRVEDYRGQLDETAHALRSIVEDPSMLVQREPLHAADEALGHTPVPTGTDQTGYYGDASAIGAESPDGRVDPPPGTEPAGPIDTDAVDLTDSTRAHDTATAAKERIEGDLDGATTPDPEHATPQVDAEARISAVIVDAEPVTGQTSDRFLRELDEAVNESAAAEGDEDAMSAFFEGDRSEGGRSRFGWRR